MLSRLRAICSMGVLLWSHFVCRFIRIRSAVFSHTLDGYSPNLITSSMLPDLKIQFFYRTSYEFHQPWCMTSLHPLLVLFKWLYIAALRLNNDFSWIAEHIFNKLCKNSISAPNIFSVLNWLHFTVQNGS